MQDRKEHTSVAIINYNTRDLLRACLSSVVPEHPDRVIVVDNASSDGSAQMVAAEFPRVTLLANASNRGYGAAANMAFSASTARYLLLLNSDTLLRRGALEAMAEYLDEHEEVGVLGPRLINEDGTLQPSCYPFPGSMRWLVDNDDLARYLGTVGSVQRRMFRTWEHDRPRHVPWVMGAALAIRREAFDAVGGFDESFFMYHEETDLCFRMAKLGWETHFAPVTEVVHKGGASTVQHRHAMSVALFESAQRFHRKHYSGFRFFAVESAWRALALIRLLFAAVRYHTAFDAELRRARSMDFEAASQIARVAVSSTRPGSPDAVRRVEFGRR